MNKEERKEKMIELRKQGKSLREVGEAVDLTSERVRQILTDHPDYDEWTQKSWEEQSKRRREYSNEKILPDIYNLAEDLGRIPRSREIRDEIDYYNDVWGVIHKRFGNMVEACKEAGILDKAFVRRKRNDKDLIYETICTNLQFVASQVDGKLTVKKYQDNCPDNMMKAVTIRGHYYFSWCEALVDAGLEPTSLPSTMKSRYTEDDIEQCLLKTRGLNITKDEFLESKDGECPTPGLMMKRTGKKWNELKQEVGLDVHLSGKTGGRPMVEMVCPVCESSFERYRNYTSLPRSNQRNYTTCNRSCATKARGMDDKELEEKFEVLKEWTHWNDLEYLKVGPK